MPELPEVEVVRRGLDRWISGRTISSVVVSHPRTVRRHDGGSADFVAGLRGRHVGAAQRRGKYLWLPLDATDALLAHLGMSGQLLVIPAGEPAQPHLRARFAFEDAGPELRFVDQRTFGHLMIVRDGADLPQPLAHIARDPLDTAFDPEDLYRVLRLRRTGVKRALLDQSLVSGVGNIYADEALWRAGLHYARPTETLSRTEVSRIVTGVREVMTEALDVGGTSFDSLYVNVNGESGYFDRSLHVYGRAGRPCPRCGATIRRDAFMNRSSYTCPHCQPQPRRARW